MERFEILAPLFPNGHDFLFSEEESFMIQLLKSSKYNEFENLILVAHSLVTIFLQNFLAKYNLKNFGKTLKQIHFVAPNRDFDDFEIDSDWNHISKQTEDIFLYSSKDDQKCEFADGQFYHTNLSKSQFVEFEDRGHFTQDNFPELINNFG